MPARAAQGPRGQSRRQSGPRQDVPRTTLRQCDTASEHPLGDQDNAMVCALVAQLQERRKARKHMARLRGPSRRAMAQQVCLKSGVDVPID